MTISPGALEKARAIAERWFLLDAVACNALAGEIATALHAERDAAAPKLPDDLAGLVAELRDAAALKKEASKFAEWVQDYSNDGHIARAARSFLDKMEGRDV